MKNIYKYLVYILFIAIAFPLINGQSIQDLNKMKEEFESDFKEEVSFQILMVIS